MVNRELPDMMFEIADGAIHLAKDEGGDGFRMGTAAESNSARDRLSLEGDLREAVEQHAFEIYYQPQVEPVSHELRDVEALLRWRHAVRGAWLGAPNGLHPIAGRDRPDRVRWGVGTGTVLRPDAGLDRRRQPLRMAVNLSLRQLMVPGLGRIVRCILERTGLQPELLEL